MYLFRLWEWNSLHNNYSVNYEKWLTLIIFCCVGWCYLLKRVRLLKLEFRLLLPEKISFVLRDLLKNDVSACLTVLEEKSLYFDESFSVSFFISLLKNFSFTNSTTSSTIFSYSLGPIPRSTDVQKLFLIRFK